jgi:uncharacterized membrane-anchored protein YitT (DUF2179 family)
MAVKGLGFRLLVITFGCLISSSSINLFFVPERLLSGGLSGIAIIAHYLIGTPIGAVMLVMNLPLLAAAYKILGKAYTLNVIFGTLMLSLCIDATSFLNAYAPVDDTLLAAVYGGVFAGIGYGMIFRVNASSGGTDIVAAIVKKYYSINVGNVLFGFNCLIMLAASFLFGVKPAMFTLISMFISATVTDKVIAGFNHRKTFIIISDKTRSISEEIISEVGRGVTFLKGEGAFSHANKDVLFVVANLTQISKIKMIVEAIDPLAFMIVQDANEVMGRGFSLPGADLKKYRELLEWRANRNSHK